MNQDDPSVILLPVRQRSCHFDEVCDVEGHQDATLTGRLSKQLGIIEAFEFSVARGRDNVMAQLLQRRGNGGRNVGIQEDCHRQLGAHRFQPGHLLP